MIASRTDALARITDTNRSVSEREEAIHFLRNQEPTEEEIKLLVSILDDDAPGVRWAAGSALAALGTRALPPLLRALFEPESNSLLRASIHHVLHDNEHPTVRKRAEPLLKVLSGPGSDVAAMEEARRWLQELLTTA